MSKRLTLVGNNPEAKAPDRIGGKPFRPHVCEACSSPDVPYTHLVQHRVGGFDDAGTLRGGAMWWCCAKCHRPYYFIASAD